MKTSHSFAPILGGKFLLAQAAAPAFQQANDEYKAKYGQDIPVISAYRDPKHNQEVGGAQHSNHLTGLAFDIQKSAVANATPILQKYGLVPQGGSYFNPATGKSQVEDNHFNYVGSANQPSPAPSMATQGLGLLGNMSQTFLGVNPFQGQSDAVAQSPPTPSYTPVAPQTASVPQISAPALSQMDPASVPQIGDLNTDYTSMLGAPVNQADMSAQANLLKQASQVASTPMPTWTPDTPPAYDPSATNGLAAATPHAPILPHDPTNFAGDIGNSFLNQAAFNIPNLPTGGGWGSQIGSTAAMLGHGALAALAPEVYGPALMALAGAGDMGSASARNQINHGGITNPMGIATDAAIGAALPMIPFSKAATLPGRMAENAARFLPTSLGATALSQGVNNGKLDLAGLKSAGAQGTALTILASLLGKPAIEPDVIPPQLKRLTGGKANETPLLTGGKASDVPLLHGDTITPTTGENPGVMMNSTMDATAPETQTPLLTGETAGQVPQLTGETITPPSHQLTTGGELLTQPTTQDVPIAGSADQLVRATTHGGLYNKLPTGGTLEQSTQGALLNGLGETTHVGAPEIPVAPPLPPVTTPEAPVTTPAPRTVDANGFVNRETLTPPTTNGQPLDQLFNNSQAATRAITNLGLDRTTVEPVNVGKKQWALHDNAAPASDVIPSQGQNGQEGPLNTQEVPKATPTDLNLSTGQQMASETLPNTAHLDQSIPPGQGKTIEQPSPVSESRGGNASTADMVTIDPNKAPRGYTVITPEQALQKGIRPDVVKALAPSIEANQALDPSTGQSLSYQYRGDRTSGYNDAHVTPIHFLENKSGNVVLGGINHEQNYVQHYLDSHSSGRGIQPDSVPVVNPERPAQFQYSRTNAGRAAKVHTDTAQSLKSQIQQVHDLIPKDPAVGASLERMIKQLGPDGKVKDFEVWRNEFSRLERSGKLDTVLKAMEKAGIGKC